MPNPQSLPSVPITNNQPRERKSSQQRMWRNIRNRYIIKIRRRRRVIKASMTTRSIYESQVNTWRVMLVYMSIKRNHCKNRLS